MLKFNDLKTGQVIEASPRRKKTVGAQTELMNEADALADPIRGRVVKIDRRVGTVTVRNPDGLETAFNWIEFIVKILPLIDTIIFWVIEKIKQIKNSRKAKTEDHDEGKSEVTEPIQQDATPQG